MTFAQTEKVQSLGQTLQSEFVEGKKKWQTFWKFPSSQFQLQHLQNSFFLVGKKLKCKWFREEVVSVLPPDFHPVR